MGWFLAVAAIVLFCWALKAAMDQQKIKIDNENAFRASRRGWDLYVSPHDTKVIGINRDAGKIVLGTTARPTRCCCAWTRWCANWRSLRIEA